MNTARHVDLPEMADNKSSVRRLSSSMLRALRGLAAVEAKKPELMSIVSSEMSYGPRTMAALRSRGLVESVTVRGYRCDRLTVSGEASVNAVAS